MKVGIVLPQGPQDGAGGSWSEIADIARRAEAGGLDSVWLSDHFLYRPDDGTEVGYHEAWTLLGALATITERVELGTLVLATSFRPAGLTAKMAVTADEVAGGRLILGLGCGWHEPEYRAFGYPFDHRVGRFEETLRIIVPLVRGERVTFEGSWNRSTTRCCSRRHAGPRCRSSIAAKGKRMLRLTALFADAWQTAWFGLPDARYAERHSDLFAACEAEGRDPATLELTVGVDVSELGRGTASTARRPGNRRRPGSVGGRRHRSPPGRHAGDDSCDLGGRDRGNPPIPGLNGARRMLCPCGR